MTRQLVRGVVLVAMAATLAGCPLGRGSKRLGDTCSHNNECAAAHCQASMCTIACKADADCATATAKLVCQGNTKTATNVEGYGTCVAGP